MQAAMLHKLLQSSSLLLSLLVAQLPHHSAQCNRMCTSYITIIIRFANVEIFTVLGTFNISLALILQIYWQQDRKSTCMCSRKKTY
uniref:Secreted protein n=1 Tax=Rhizophora mucronata TaxID=61149 RepID=A0A2P2LL94_RHIMU